MLDLALIRKSCSHTVKIIQQIHVEERGVALADALHRLHEARGPGAADALEVAFKRFNLHKYIK
jgi:hypothetical protein